MPSTLDFVRLVLPWPEGDALGYVGLHWLGTDKKYGMPGYAFRNPEDMVSQATWMATRPSHFPDIYFCLSTQSTHGKLSKSGRHHMAVRKNGKTAVALQTVWIDIDVKNDDDHYHTLADVYRDLARFNSAAVLPAPSALVESGGGLHVYWASNKPLTPEEWRPYAEGLKSELLRLGLKCDAGLTTDVVRVLRMPGTFNSKFTPPKPVVLRHVGQAYDFKTKLRRLAEIGGANNPASQSSTNRSFYIDGYLHESIVVPTSLRGLTGQGSLQAGLGLTHDERPLEINGLIKNCPHFADAALTHGASYSQSLWHLDVLAATFLKEGRRWAHYFSSGYANYSHEETEKMWDRKLAEKESRGLGWPSCSAIEAAGCKSCATCPFRGRIRSPLNLADRMEPIPSAATLQKKTQEVGMSSSLTTRSISTSHPDTNLPEGYIIDTKGRINRLLKREKDDEDGPQDTQLLFHEPMKEFELFGSPRKIAFMANTEIGDWEYIAIEEADLYNAQKVLPYLASKGVHVPLHAQLQAREFMISFVGKIAREKKRMNSVAYGWLVDKEKGKRTGWAYGGKLYKDMNGGTNRVAEPDLDLAEAYRPHGKYEPWVEAVKLVTDQQHPALEVPIAAAFGAPLLFTTAKQGGIIWAHGEGGAHKSTSMDIGQAVWGHPKLASESPLSSDKGVIHKMGILKNIPIFVDEINDTDRLSKMTKVLEIMTAGVGGTLLKSDRSFHHRDDWQTTVTCASNHSMWAEIYKLNKDCDAKFQRVFEFRVEKRLDSKTDTTLDISRMIGNLHYNYGIVGERYSLLLTQNIDLIDKYTAEVCKKFNADTGALSEERFRSALAGTMIAGANLANNMQLGINLNTTLLYNYLKDEFLHQREEILNMNVQGINLPWVTDRMARFVSFVAPNIIRTKGFKYKGKGRPSNEIAEGPPKDQQRPVFMRIATGDSLVAFSEAAIDDWAKKNEENAWNLKNGLRKLMKAEFVRANLCGGTVYNGATQPCIVLNVHPDSALGELLKKPPEELVNVHG